MLTHEAKILTRIFSVQFYQKHVALFLLGLAFAGGFMRSADHIALGLYFVSSAILITIPISVWILYALLVSHTNRSITRLPENSFLSDFAFLPLGVRWQTSMVVTSVELLPAFAYGIFLLLLSAGSANYIQSVIIFISLLVLLISCTAFLHRTLMNPIHESPGTTLPKLIARIRRPHAWFTMEAAIREQLPAIAGLKILSLALIFAAARLCELEEYDIRLPGIFVVMAFALNVSFILECHRFQNNKFILYRQMPYTILRRYGHMFTILCGFSLPEGLLLLRNLNGFPPSQVLLVWFLGLSINMLFYSFLYVRDRTQPEVMPYFYGMSIFFFVSVLASVPLLVLALLNSAVAFILVARYYYRFEYIARPAD